MQQNRDRCRRFYERHKSDPAFLEEQRKKMYSWRDRHPSFKEEERKKALDRYHKNRDLINKRTSTYRQNSRIKVIELYGGICVGCGCSDLPVLTIDHVNNDGAKDRHGSYWARIFNDGKKREDLQCLCYNCNMGRKKVYGSDLSKWPKPGPTIENIVIPENVKIPHRVPKGTYEEGRAGRVARYIKNREMVLANMKAQSLRAKRKVMIMYGGQCMACGEKELATLSIDHIHDDGKKDKKTMGSAFYRLLARTPKRDDLQCMCLNCNLGRKVRFGPDISQWKMGK